MGSRFESTFDCTAELFSGSKLLETLKFKGQGKMKPIDPGDYKLAMKVVAKAELKMSLPKGLVFEETFDVTWKVVVADDGSLSFEDRRTSKLKYEYLVGGMTLDKYENGKDSARMGVEIEIEGETQRSDFEVTLKGNPAASKARKVVKFPLILNVGSFPTNVSEVKKIKVKPAGYSDWTGLKKFYDGLPEMTRRKIENGEKPGDLPIEIIGFADDTGNAPDNSKLGEKRAMDVMGWFKTWSGNRSDSIYRTKGEGSGLASKGKEDPKKRFVMISLVGEKEY